MFSLGKFFSGLAEKFGDGVSTGISVAKRGDFFEVWVSVRVISPVDVKLDLWGAVADLASSSGFLDSGLDSGDAFERRYFARSEDVRG